MDKFKIRDLEKLSSKSWKFKFFLFFHINQCYQQFDFKITFIIISLLRLLKTMHLYQLFISFFIGLSLKNFKDNVENKKIFAKFTLIIIIQRNLLKIFSLFINCSYALFSASPKIFKQKILQDKRLYKHISMIRTDCITENPCCLCKCNTFALLDLNSKL